MKLKNLTDQFKSFTNSITTKTEKKPHVSPGHGNATGLSSRTPMDGAAPPPRQSFKAPSEWLARKPLPAGSPEATSGILWQALKEAKMPSGAELLTLSKSPEPNVRKGFRKVLVDSTMPRLAANFGKPESERGAVLASLVSSTPDLKKDVYIAKDDQFTALALVRSTLGHIGKLEPAELTQIATAALNVSTQVGHEAHTHYTGTAIGDQFGGAVEDRTAMRAAKKKDTTSNQAVKLATEAIEGLRLAGVDRLDDGLVQAAAKALAEGPTSKAKHLGALYSTLTAMLPGDQRAIVDKALDDANRLHGFFRGAAAEASAAAPTDWREATAARTTEPPPLPPRPNTPEAIGNFVSKALKDTNFSTAAELLQMTNTSYKDEKRTYADFTAHMLERLPNVVGEGSPGDMLARLVSATPQLREDSYIGSDQQFTAIAIARTVAKHQPDQLEQEDFGKIATAALLASTQVGSGAHLHVNGNTISDNFAAPFAGLRQVARKFKKDSTSNQALKLATEMIDKMVAGGDVRRMDDGIVGAATKVLCEVPTGSGRHVSQLYNSLIKGLDTEQRITLDRTLNDAGRLGLATKYQQSAQPVDALKRKGKNFAADMKAEISKVKQTAVQMKQEVSEFGKGMKELGRSIRHGDEGPKKTT